MHIAAIIWSTRKRGTRIVNFLCRVLWRNTFMPANAPADPPKKASSSSVDSGMRHLSCFAFHLSIPKAEKVIRLMRAAVAAMMACSFISVNAKVTIFGWMSPAFFGNLAEDKSKLDMILTTTPTVEGRQIREYRGVVFGEVVAGVNFLRDFAASIRNFVGGRSGSYEDELIRAREQAMNEMSDRARSLGANAVVGIDIDYEVLGEGGGMLMVTASGTAVVLE